MKQCKLRKLARDMVKAREQARKACKRPPSPKNPLNAREAFVPMCSFPIWGFTAFYSKVRL